ncbi:MAG: cytidine deaminase [Chloroflexota bacterium]|jgi:cytidine deaminase|nr:cytidine deaminase [Chloroflexota bacterium]
MDLNDAKNLMDYARAATATAYVPYSDFPVGAAVLTESGAIFAGANIENASYPLTCCAERTAIYAAVNAGHRVIKAVAVTAPRVVTVTPCGGCRQVLNEFKPAEGDMQVILDGDDLTIVPLADLLPRAFGPRDLD